MQAIPGLYSKSGELRWLLVFVFISLAIFLFSRLFETQVTNFVISVFPADPGKGYVFYQDFVVLCFGEMLWISFFFLLVYFFNSFFSPAVILAEIETRVLHRSFFFALVITGLAFCLTLVIGLGTLEAFPNSSDEYAYIYQAETMSKGLLWQPQYPHDNCFHFNHIIQKDGMRIGRFPPGWPALLSASFMLGFHPSLVNPILGVGLLLVTFAFAKKHYGARTACWSVAALAFTGFFLFNAASYFSHTSCALAAVLFVYFAYEYLADKKAKWALLSGLFLGLVILIRYYTAVLIFIPFFIYLVYTYRLESFRFLVLLGLGTLPCLAFLFWYNYSVTGNPLLPVTVWGYEDEKLGFVNGHTFLTGIEHIVRRFFMFMYWCSPGLLILYFYFLLKKIATKDRVLERPEDYFFVVLMAGYFFYYQIGGNQYGPRFLFEALPFVVILVVHRVLQSGSRWMTAVLLASLLYAVVKLPFVAAREAYIVDERQDIYDLVERNNVRNAVVLIASPVSPVRPMPIGDLTRNDQHLSNDVIYVQECIGSQADMIERFEGKAFYRYERGLDDATGMLVRIR